MIKVWIIMILLNTMVFSEKIKIPGKIEASGISIYKDNLYIASDNGKMIVLNNKIEVIETIKYDVKMDLEGIAHDLEGNIYMAEEGEETIISLNKDFTIKNKFKLSSKFEGEKVFKRGDNQGIESLTFYKNENGKLHFFTSNQSKKTYGKDKSSIMEITIDLENYSEARIINYFPMDIIDISGMFYDNKTKQLFFISDTLNKIYEINKVNGDILQEENLNGNDQEGIFIENGIIYIAQDDGFLTKHNVNQENKRILGE